MKIDVAIISGSGKLPLLVEKGLNKMKKSTVIFGISEEFDKSNETSSKVEDFDIGKLSQLKKLIKEYDPDFVTVVGAISRVKHRINILDLENWKLAASSLKDKDLINSFIIWLERHSKLISSHWFLPSLIKRKYLVKTDYSKLNPYQKNHLRMFSDLHWADLGQVVITKNERVIAIEGPEGTDNTIIRAKSLITGRLQIYKFPKVGQDLRIDMPALGLQTLELLKDRPKSQLIFHAAATLIENPDLFVKKAKQYDIKLISIENLPWSFDLGPKP